MSINSLEVNNLILQYLKENNLLLSYNAIKYELNEKYNINISNNNVPYGMLINLIQKGIFYSQLESLKTNSNTRFIDDNIYTLQQLYEDNKEKLLYANKNNNKMNKKRKYNEDEERDSNTSFTETQNVTYDEIELEYKQRFSKAFEVYEQNCLKSELNNSSDDNSIKQSNVEKIEPIVKYNTSCFAALSNDSLVSTIKEPSRERGFLTSINLNNLIDFREDQHVGSIKMSKVIKKKMQMIDEPKETPNENSISLSALSNKDLLYYHLQNSNNTNIVESNDTIKEEEVVLFNQPSSNLIQFSKDKTLFSVGLTDGTVLLYNSPENKLITKLTMHHNTILHMNFNDNKTLLITIDTKGSIIVWNLKNFEIIKIIENIKIPGFESLFITNLKFMIPLKEENKTLIGIYEVSDDLTKIKQLGRLKNSSSPILNMKMFSKYNLLLTLNDDNMVRIYKGKNTSTPTVTSLLTAENDNILDVFINEVNENMFLISGVTIKAKLTNLLINISEDNCTITQLNTNTSLLMDVDEVPIIATDLFKKKFLVLGQVNGNVHVFDVSKLFSSTDESDEKILLKYQYLEKEENTHLTYMNVFDKEDRVYVNVGFDKGCSKIFNIKDIQL